MRYLQADSKGRIALGAKYAYTIFLKIEKNKVIILKKFTVIPKRELWLHKNKKAKKAVLKGLEEAKKYKFKPFP
jgi:hypothetical protein